MSIRSLRLAAGRVGALRLGAPFVAPLAVLALGAFGLPAFGSPAPDSLQAAVQAGAHAFANDSFGGHSTCIACHSNGGFGPGKTPSGMALPSLQGAAARFPQWRGGKLVTLQMQVTRCIRGAFGGTPPAPDSARMAELLTYLTALSRGVPMGQQLPELKAPASH